MSKKEIDIAVQLVDTIINSARILGIMLNKSKKEEVDLVNKGKKKKVKDLEKELLFQEALKDFRDDPDVLHLYCLGVKAKKEKIYI